MNLIGNQVQISCLHMANQGNVPEAVLLWKRGKLNSLGAAHPAMKIATVVYLLRSKSCTNLYVMLIYFAADFYNLIRRIVEKKGKNQGRVFYNCSKTKYRKQCDYFRWKGNKR